MFVVVEIGCLECGYASQVIGVFTTRQLAELAADQCGGEGNHGDTEILVDEIEAFDQANKAWYNE